MQRLLIPLAVAALGCQGGAADRPPTRPPAEATTPPPTGPGGGLSDEAAADGSDPCRGLDVDLAAALWSRRCEVDEASARTWAEALTPARIQSDVVPQTPDITAGRDLVLTWTVTNPGNEPLALPFFAHLTTAWVVAVVDLGPGSTATLRPIAPQVARSDYGPQDRGHYALVTLEPGGTAHLRVRVEAKPVRQDFSKCPPMAKCPPRWVDADPLPVGVHTLRLIHTPLVHHMPQFGPVTALEVR